jgi:UDP-GlcNAc:undecaprenyl-phosphate GlcNAc-1-phosphate transferase
VREYLLVALIALGVTYLTSGLCRRLAFRFGAVAQVRDRDVHVKPIPYFGGISMCLGLAAAVLVGSRLPWLGSLPAVQHDALAILCAGVVICVVGVVDDMIELGPLAKIAGQLLAAGLVAVNGVQVYWLPLPGVIYSLDAVTSALLTVGLVFVAVNAVNLIDGLDGLAAGVVAIGAAAFFVFGFSVSVLYQLDRSTTASLISVATVGICLGFLPYNVHRARMFMGDSGSMLLGFLMVTAAISMTGQIDPSSLGRRALAAYLPVILPLAVLALPLADLILAYVRRTVRGRLWFEADKEHLHHRLLRRGHSHFKAVALLWLWASVISFGVVAIGLFPGLVSVLAVGAGIVVIAILTFSGRPASDA